MGQALQEHHEQHHVQAAVSTQLQSNDEELRDRVLGLEKLLLQANEAAQKERIAQNSILIQLYNNMKELKKRSETTATAQTVAPTVADTVRGGPSSARMQGARQARADTEEEEEDWEPPRKDSSKKPSQKDNGGGGGRAPPPRGGAGNPDPGDSNSDDGY